jgi:hypothetical protein
MLTGCIVVTLEIMSMDVDSQMLSVTEVKQGTLAPADVAAIRIVVHLDASGFYLSRETEVSSCIEVVDATRIALAGQASGDISDSPARNAVHCSKLGWNS